jgi:hypothetical protein
VPEGSVDGEVMLRAAHGAGLTVIVMFLSDVCAPPAQLSVALTVNVEVPATDGVPLISPDVLMFNPGGNAPDTTLKVTGACPPDVAI